LIPEETTEPVDYETLEDNEPKIPYEEILPPQGLQDEIGAVVNAHLDDANAQIESYKSKAKDAYDQWFEDNPQVGDFIQSTKEYYEDFQEVFDETREIAEGIFEETQEVFDETRDIVEQGVEEVTSVTADFLAPAERIPYLVLPDPLPHGQPPITILIEAEIFAHYEPDTLRAGAEYFFRKAQVYAEIVVTANGSVRAISDMMNQIDPEPPYNHSFRVGAEQWAVNFENYPYQRDLQKLNRPLSTILVLDHSKKPYQKFQENVIILPKQIWWADDEDTDLFDLVPFIKYISEQVAKKQDIRDVLPHYESIDPSALVRHVMREQAAAGPRGRVTRVDQQPF